MQKIACDNLLTKSNRRKLEKLFSMYDSEGMEIEQEVYTMEEALTHNKHLVQKNKSQKLK